MAKRNSTAATPRDRVSRISTPTPLVSTREREEWYGSPRAFSKNRERLVAGFCKVMVQMLSGDFERNQYGDCTVRYGDDVIAQVKDALEEALLAVQAATPTFTKEALAARSARADHKYQAFLGKLVRGDGEVVATRRDRRSRRA
jgi:hypothetical protein